MQSYSISKKYFCNQYSLLLPVPKSFRAIHSMFMLEQGCACENFHNNVTS